MSNWDERFGEVARLISTWSKELSENIEFSI